MKNILGIARREFGVAFSSPLAYIVIGVFLLVCGIKFFFFPGVFLFGRASYRTFFDWMPAFLSVLAPALMPETTWRSTAAPSSSAPRPPRSGWRCSFPQPKCFG